MILSEKVSEKLDATAKKIGDLQKEMGGLDHDLNSGDARRKS